MKRLATLIAALVMIVLVSGETFSQEEPIPTPEEQTKLAILEINNSQTPAQANAARKRGMYIDRVNIGLHNAYMQRMLHFGRDSEANKAAKVLVYIDEENGEAWSVIAYNHLLAGDSLEALKSVLKAARYIPQNPIVQRLTGQLLAWYDAAPQRPALTLPERRMLYSARARMVDKAPFTEAYKEVMEVYERMDLQDKKTQPQPPEQIEATDKEEEPAEELAPNKFTGHVSSSLDSVVYYNTTNYYDPGYDYGYDYGYYPYGSDLWGYGGYGYGYGWGHGYSGLQWRGSDYPNFAYSGHIRFVTPHRKGHRNRGLNHRRGSQGTRYNRRGYGGDLNFTVAIGKHRSVRVSPRKQITPLRNRRISAHEKARTIPITRALTRHPGTARLQTSPRVRVRSASPRPSVRRVGFATPRHRIGVASARPSARSMRPRARPASRTASAGPRRGGTRGGRISRGPARSTRGAGGSGMGFSGGRR